MKKLGGNPILNHILLLIVCYWTHFLATADTRLSLNQGMFKIGQIVIDINELSVKKARLGILLA